MESYPPLKSPLTVQGLPLNVPQFYELNEKTNWLIPLLEELNEDVDISKRSGFSSFLSLDLEITRRDERTLGNYITLIGAFKVQYLTYCVRCYEIMEEIQETDVNAVVIPREYRSLMNLEDEETFFVDNGEWDLFFYDLKVNLAEIIHEYLYLHKNPYPKKSNDLPFE